MYVPKFNWSKYLDLAEDLARRHGDEAAQRSAVSRAYYAVYCRARNTLEQRQMYTRKQNSKTSHKDVWDIFEGARDREWERIGQGGHNLKKDRELADYEDEIRRLDNLTSAAIRRAKALERQIRRLPN